jgi:hypothetical protein
MFAMSLHSDLQRLDDEDRLELEWSASDLFDSYL